MDIILWSITNHFCGISSIKANLWAIFAFKDLTWFFLFFWWVVLLFYIYVHDFIKYNWSFYIFGVFQSSIQLLCRFSNKYVARTRANLGEQRLWLSERSSDQETYFEKWERGILVDLYQYLLLSTLTPEWKSHHSEVFVKSLLPGFTDSTLCVRWLLRPFGWDLWYHYRAEIVWRGCHSQVDWQISYLSILLAVAIHFVSGFLPLCSVTLCVLVASSNIWYRAQWGYSGTSQIIFSFQYFTSRSM